MFDSRAPYRRTINRARLVSYHGSVTRNFMVCVAAGLMLLARDASYGQAAPGGHDYQKDVVPFMQAYCVDCHSGDGAEAMLTLDRYEDSSRVQQEFALWEKIVRMVGDRQMPPDGAEQPGEEELQAWLSAVEAELATFDCLAGKRPGRVTIRRLNRVEYDNTVQDLFGLDLHPAAAFPSDDVGHGFDNIGDVLSIPPILMEKYLEAAESVVDQVFADPDAYGRLMVHQAASDEGRIEAFRKNIFAFAERAFRRPLTDEDQRRLFELARGIFDSGASDKEIAKTVCTAILVSPHFLFRVERDPAGDDEDGVRTLDDWELASRLSYFLWSTMPDETLFAAARDGRLSDPEELLRQVDRMLASPRAGALVDNFAGQWLQLRDVATRTPDPGLFPQFDPALRAAMRRETELFFADVVREDRSVLEFLQADFSYLNQRLAEHYGIAGVAGDTFRRVELPAERRGVLTHASVLLITSNPTRTSPVKRGKWILENILGTPPPPPPPNVPELDADAETLGTLRERMEQHRTNPSCAVCHETMDTLGFGFENFDAVGAWREQDGRAPIDPAGNLPDGTAFTGAADLSTVLATRKRDAFCRCLAEKLLTYALGRGLESYDRCTVNEITQRLEQEDYRFSALVKGIVSSDAFRQRERLGDQ